MGVRFNIEYFSFKLGKYIRAINQIGVTIDVSWSKGNRIAFRIDQLEIILIANCLHIDQRHYSYYHLIIQNTIT